jgi:hypothetical protein
MSPRSFFSIVLIFLTACSALLVPTPTDSGIVGQVTIGPMCPVMQIGVPCPDKPYQAILTILTAASRSKVIQFKTDSNSGFQTALSPGEYILHPESPGVMPHAAEISFVVYAHQFTRVDVTYDSGIR